MPEVVWSLDGGLDGSGGIRESVRLGLAGAASATGLEEAADGEVGEQQGDAAGDQEVLVGGVVERGLVQVSAVGPGALAGEEGEEGEEGAGELEPEDAGKFDERPPDGGPEALAAADDAGAGLLDLGGGSNGGLGGGLEGAGRGCRWEGS